MIRIKRIGNHDLPLPARAHEDDAGLDLSIVRNIMIPHMAVTRVRTGFAWEIPKGYVGKIFDRSGSSAKLFMALGGVIDAGFRGEVEVSLFNFGQHPLVFGYGERIAQMVVIPICGWKTNEVAELSLGERGDKGFGSTGQ